MYLENEDFRYGIDSVRSVYVAACALCNIEIAALLDASTKSSPSDWQNMINFLNSFVASFNINSNCVRQAVVRYADSARVDFRLTRHTNLASLQQAIQIGRASCRERV